MSNTPSVMQTNIMSDPVSDPVSAPSPSENVSGPAIPEMQSMSPPSSSETCDPMQLTIIQKQLAQQQKKMEAQSTNNAIALSEAVANTAQQITSATTNATATTTSTIWKNVSNMSLIDICTNLKTNQGGSGPVSGPVSNNNPQSINSINTIQISEMCASLTANGNVASFKGIQTSQSVLQKTPLTTSDGVMPYCNPLATNSSSYQTDQCVCNQLGPTPVLHRATLTAGGLAGIGQTTTTGYYCSTK